jgi:hypothetical protein
VIGYVNQVAVGEAMRSRGDDNGRSVGGAGDLLNPNICSVKVEEGGLDDVPIPVNGSAEKTFPTLFEKTHFSSLASYFRAN